ncbi:D-hexose-6-phosphate mutarotase [Ramlibacter rhizophilus]|uniref:Putative glucose-6-phosphate 1-epimerase n=1 Tax=Ramlibacter rhizophilus TaxID=1781167 RepID=A0A4Z0C2W0_9BURK|nr:D-hexose-6-phosphate mutarotase [Ramlibacter rhizophilus]TFZ04529.1 D-hexose-6-phosphate mutarotase [Ramlibacter rhizophilus]
MDSRFDHLGLLVRELADGSRVVVSRFGGHVLSWFAGGRERLYLSRNAIADGCQPIRGGVPVCFPQFSSRGTLAKHGFARTRVWSEVPSAAADTIHLRLVEDAESLRLWPRHFALDLHVRLHPQALDVELAVCNTGGDPWSVTGALHTYIRIEDLHATRLLGLEGLRVEDMLCRTFTTSLRDSPDLSHPIDSVYHDVTGPLELRDLRQCVRIEQSGFADAVVWNPGEVAAARIADIGPGEEREFLCVEAAQVQSPVLLEAGQSWLGRQVLRIS